MALALLVCSSYSSSEEVFGTTNNAAQFGYNWVMTNVLPQQAGLRVNGVIYQYTAVKETQDDMLVHVQNENARGPGYIFRETDDWSGLPGNTINKLVPINMIDISYWGNGSIEVEGTGAVEDAEVIYSYQYDPCFDPQSDPNCPGYVDLFSIEVMNPDITDPLDEEYVQAELDRKANMKAQEEEEREEARKKALANKTVEKNLESILGIVKELDMFSSQALLQHDLLVNLNLLPNSYQVALKGGVYPDGQMPPDGKLPSNKNGLRLGMGSQILHDKLVELQYEKK